MSLPPGARGPDLALFTPYMTDKAPTAGSGPVRSRDSHELALGAGGSAESSRQPRNATNQAHDRSGEATDQEEWERQGQQRDRGYCRQRDPGQRQRKQSHRHDPAAHEPARSLVDDLARPPPRGAGGGLVDALAVGCFFYEFLLSSRHLLT